MIRNVPLPSPFSIRWAAEHIRASSFGAPYTFVSETRFRRLLNVAGSARLVEYSLEACAEGGCLRTVLLGPESNPLPQPRARRVRKEIARISRFVFGLDDDIEAAYIVLNRTRRMSPLVRRYHGLRLVKAADLYEALLIAILGQQVSVASAQSLRKRLMTALGRGIRFEGQIYFGTPDPDRLMETGEPGLREIGISRQKARYLIEIAQEVVGGRLSPECFDGEPCERVIDRLMEIPGVGRWTAEIAAMRGLGFQDVFPAGDLGLQVAVQRTFGLDHRPSEGELRKIANRWRGYRSYAALYLWMTLMEKGYA